MKILILSDSRPGHLNQSIAFAKHIDATYIILDISFKNRFFKLLAPLFDFFRCYTSFLLKAIEYKESNYNLIVSTGSSTYYANKLLSRQHQIKSLTMMLPRGYRYDFDFIFAQLHDNPPIQNNIIPIPANFSYIQPQGLYQPTQKSIGIIIGGDNKVFTMHPDVLKKQLNAISAHFKNYHIAITSSPRTSPQVEALIQTYHFEYEVLFSKNPVNPIPDFLHHCEYIFITNDSTSMISEAISYGKSNVIVLPLTTSKENKFSHFVNKLNDMGYLHLYNGHFQAKHKKINFHDYTKKVTS